jgi:RND family efflux transporter MFP subunit
MKHHARTLFIAAASLACALTLPTLAQTSATPTLTATPGSATTGPGGNVQIFGQTEPYAKVDVPAGMKGLIASIDVKEGQPVKKGETLAKLDDTIQQKQVEAAALDANSDAKVREYDVTLASAKNEYDRVKNSSAANATEKRNAELKVKQLEIELEMAKQDQKKAQVKLDQEKITLDKMTIKSPIDGAVLRVNKRPGEETDENPLIVVVQVNKLNAVFYPPKQLFGKIKVGDKFTLAFATDPPVKREAAVSTIDPIIEQSLFRVKFEVDNADNKIPAGTAVTWNWKP